ncbi:alpha beta-hydrolase [Coniophora puteana RWD-64-598 SS2]|uniref:Alpha beta-hydrolase n=1 Tax=Coniophora puteana (strain RWD-64-598) TaxID=741705 RepID=A0A5M3N1T2_CONPW|nr:alpha beta-hydrolase [Coniophora puteana RWD-64-598 SS2]EIW85266.1 alpha beta-hydrolase [Coniophora puteana RWD-64-598 SS2]
MSGQERAPYGTWKSDINAETVAQSSKAILDVIVDPIKSTVYHVELRPAEKGRYVIVNTKTNDDVINSPWSARTAVHEYGGASAIVHDDTLYFSNFSDNRLYHKSLKSDSASEPEPVTPENPFHRFANFAVTPTHPHLLVSILEDHTEPGHAAPQDVVNTLCVINTASKTVTHLVSGADFYTSPCFSPNGRKLAWEQWNHPDMPWEGSQIWVADVSVEKDTIVLSNSTVVAGKDYSDRDAEDISVSYPTWASNEKLIFTSDKSGFQNPWVFSVKTKTAGAVFPKPVDEDFGAPAWSLSYKPYALLDQDGSTALFAAMRDGRNILYSVNLASASPKPPIELTGSPFTVVDMVHAVAPQVIVFSGKRADADGGVVLCTLTPAASSGGSVGEPTFEIISKAKEGGTSLSSEYISLPKPKALYSQGSNDPVYAVYYGPKNPRYSGSSIEGEKPPCIVNLHGGPTSATYQTLSWMTQYWTSRGYAWLDVNYGGSSGYGRKYIQRLAGRWGIVDVRDSIAAPRALADAPHSLIDGRRVAVRGGSAGGYTVLAAMSLNFDKTAHDPTAFTTGVSSYGISDFVELAQDTHKFELRYMEKLLGGTSEELYKSRSPVEEAKNIVKPLLILQGKDDKVVPPKQSQAIKQAIKDQTKVKLVEYEGEGHGWRQARTIVDALVEEQRWYEEWLLSPKP